MSSIAAMVMSIKNNKRTRKSTFKKLEKNGSYSKKTRLFFIKMSLRNSQEIPERYQREHNKRKQKRPYWKNKYLSYSNCYHNLLYRFRKILTNT